jgi:hypothetical protein
VTPGFDAFLAEIDGADAQPVESAFWWRLHAGVNRLAVRPKNIAGRDGITSFVELNYHP